MKTFALKTAVRAAAANALFALSLAGAAHAGPQFVDKAGIANFGYDVVAYQTTFTATKGTKDFTATYDGATFWFASAANRDMFTKNPAAFAPAYDGHCAFAVANNKKLTVDPEAFSVVDPVTHELVSRTNFTPGAGRVYLNYDPGVNKKFNADTKGIIAKSDYAWKDCLEKRPAAKPEKGISDLFPAGRAASCPK